MSLFNAIAANLPQPRKLLQGVIEDYISFAPQSKQVILKKKTVISLCQQVESRVEQIKSIQPDEEEGLIATIEVNKIQVKLHFIPDKITLHQDCLQGEIRLLNPPKLETESIVYRYLIAGWQTFLGGKIPNGVLPKEVRIDKDRIYYNLPRQQLQLLDILFHTLENDSALVIDIKKAELKIQSSVALRWDDFKLQSLLQLLQRK
jgi:hypothetical protein